MEDQLFKAGYRTLSIRIITLSLLFIFVNGCAGLVAKSRMNKFSEITKSYERALEMSEFRVASKYVDGPAVDLKPYANIKIVRYKITDVNVSEDKRSIEQDVELQYFLLDQNRMKTVNDHQVWHYKDEGKVWMLQTGLPTFRQKK